MQIALGGEVFLPQLDAAIRASHLRFVQNDDGLWAPTGSGTDADSLLLEISGVTFVSPAALAQLVIVMQQAALSGIGLEVRMPNSRRAYDFIGHARFLEAIQEGPDRALAVNVQRRGTDSAALYGAMLPFRWVTHDRLDAWLSVVLARRNADGGALVPGTAEPIARIVLHELVQNANEHSGTQRALVAAWSRNSPLDVKSTQYLQSEQPAFRAYRRSSFAPLHLIVADAGVGIQYTLKSHAPERMSDDELLSYAFDRRSSRVGDSADRGTRGLYRVARLASMNAGHVTLRSGQSSATASLGIDPMEDSRARTTGDPAFPGAVILVELPLLAAQDQPTAVLGEPTGAATVRIVHRSVAALGANWLNKELKYSPVSTDTLLVVTHGRSALSHREGSAVVSLVAKMAHPKSVALAGLMMGPAELALVAEAVNREAMDRTASIDSYEDLGPVLLIGDSVRNARWAGVQQSVVDAVVDGTSVPVGSTAVNLVQRDRTEREWRLRDVAGELESSLLAHYREALIGHLRPAREGEIFVTRSLAATSGWVNVSAFTRATREDTSVLAALLFDKLRDQVPESDLVGAQIVAEAATSRHLGETLATALNGSTSAGRLDAEFVRDEDVLAGRHLNLDPGRPVLVLVNAVSEGTAARRLVAYATRQGFRVVAVVTLLDARRNIDDLQVWRSQIPVAALVAHDLSAPAGASARRRTYLGRYGDVEVVAPLPRPKLPPHDAIRSLSDAGAIFLGHYEGSQGRHLTFLIDAERALRNEAARAQLTGACVRMLRANAPTPNFIVAEADGKVPSPSGRLAEILASELGGQTVKREDAVSARDFRSEPVPIDCLLVIWGAVTGRHLHASIVRLARAGAASIAVLVLFSQLSADTERELRALRAVEGANGIAVPVKVLFVSRLAVSAYAPERCPMCLQEPRKAPQRRPPVAPDEALRERVRFAAREARTADAGPSIRDTISEQYEGGSRGIVGAALLRRSELTRASWSTSDAYDLARRWTELRSDPAFLFGLSTLLVYEPSWLREPPLSNETLRSTLADSLAAASLRYAREGTDGEFARLIIGLRIMTKERFVGVLERLLVATAEKPTRFALLSHLTDRLVAREYLPATGLLLDTQAALRGARSALASRQARDGARQMLAELVERTSARLDTHDLRKARTDTLVRSLGQSARIFLEHPERDAFVLTRVAPGVVPNQAVVDAWAHVREMIETELAPKVAVAFDYLALTSTFETDRALVEVFAVRDDRIPIVDRAVTVLQICLDRRIPPDRDQQMLLDEARGRVGALLYGGTEPGNDRDSHGLLPDAVDRCGYSVGQVLEHFRGEASRNDVRLEADPSCGALASEFATVPDSLLDSFTSAVLENAIEHGGRIATVALGAARDAASGLLTLKATCLGSRERPRDPKKLGLGHIDSLRSRVPSGIRIFALQEQAGFATVMEIDPWRRS